MSNLLERCIQIKSIKETLRYFVFVMLINIVPPCMNITEILYNSAFE